MTETMALPAATHDRTLVALSPGALPQAQSQLRDWLTRKIQTLGTELREQRQNLRIAKTAKWRHSGWLTAVRRTKGRMIYYAKMQQAVQAGYLIIPNFPLDVLAVRVQRPVPPSKTGHFAQNINRAQPEQLLPGHGRYVDGVLLTSDASYDRAVLGQPGKTEKVPLRETAGYDEVDFPVQAVHPAVLDATAHAMALKLFDRIGLVTGLGGRDPIVVGQFMGPKSGYSQRVVTFFIAWWLDPETL